MTAFYKNIFGWQPMLEMEGITFFNLHGMVFALFPIAALREDAGIPLDGKGWKQMSFSVNYATKDAVDKQIDVLRQKKVQIVKAPQDVFWGGYHAYVADPEMNLWELAWNPLLNLDSEGKVLGHQ